MAATGRLDVSSRVAWRGGDCWRLMRRSLEGGVIRMHAQWVESGKADFRVRAAPDLAWGFQMQRATAMVDFRQEHVGILSCLGGMRALSFPAQ